jgi:hypothetical protein
MSDWDATYDGVAVANNGLDLEMPSPRFMNAKTLLGAVKDGRVKESTIDDKILLWWRWAQPRHRERRHRSHLCAALRPGCTN